MGRMPPKLRDKKADDSPQPIGQSRAVESTGDPSSPRAAVNSSGLETIDLSELMQTFDSDTNRKRSPSPKKKKFQTSSDDEDDDDPTPPSPKPKSKLLKLQGASPSKPTTASTSQSKSASVSKAKVPKVPFKPKVLLPRKFKPASSGTQFKAKISKNKEKSTTSTQNIAKSYKDTSKIVEDPEVGSEDEAEEEEEILVSERKKMQEDGRNIFALMTPEDTQEFLSRLQRQCSPLDKATYISRERHIKWNNVAFGAYGEYQCKCVWAFFRTYTRRHRILYELITEVKLKLTDSVAFQFKLIESIPGFPQKPPSISHAFHIYNREKWNEIKESVQDPKDLPNFIKFQQQCKEEYNCLSREQKRMYEERASLAQAEYERQVKAFYAANPGVAKLVERLHGDEAIRKEKLKKLQAEVKAEKRKNDRETKRLEAKLHPAPIKERVKVLKLPNPYADAPQPPQTAVVLFIQAKLNRIDPPPSADDIPIYKTRFLNKWKKLSGPKKVKWIDYCISLCEEFLLEVEKYRAEHPGYVVSKGLKVKQLLTRDELALWETEHGKPVPPKGTVFDLFMEELIKSDTTLSEMSENERDSLARNKWSELDWYHKEMYRMKYKISIVEYKKQVQNFFSGLPEFMKEWCLERIPKRFQKICNEVDTVPQDETMIPSEQNEDSSTQHPPPKKKKKDTKSKSSTVVKHQSSSEAAAHKPTSSNYQEDQSLSVSRNSIADTAQQQHVFEEPKPSPKKRKRKARDPDLITGDIFSDSQSESQTDGEGEQRRSKRGLQAALLNSSTPIYQQDVTDDMRKELKLLRHKPGAKGVDEQFSEAVKQQVDLMQEADEKTVHHITEAFVKKNKRIKYPQTTKVTQRDIFNTIRGIFDARAHLGYDYSVYYYYAKHVGGDRYWIDCVNSKGLEKAGLKLIKSFLSLNDHQKEVFIGDSARWHMSLKHQVVEASGDLYPGEPRPPPSSVVIFYRDERKKQQRRFPDIEYPEKYVQLDPVTQNYYVKKLYHETKLYMRRYDMFIKSMTPNDLVGFAVFKARNWEKDLYRRSTIKKAIDEYIFPFCKKESKLNFDDEMSQPAEPAKKTKPSKKKITRKKREKNPFADDFDLMMIAKKLPHKKKQRDRIPWRRTINPLNMQLAECQRIIKHYADMNIVVKSKKRNRKDLVDGRFLEKRCEDKRRLRHLQWKCRMLAKKAEILANLRASESTQTTEGNPDTIATETNDPLCAANETVEVHLNENEGSGENQDQVGDQNPQNPIGNDGEGSVQQADQVGDQNPQNPIGNDGEGSVQNADQVGDQNPQNPIGKDGEGSGQNQDQVGQQNPKNPIVNDVEGSGLNAEINGQQNPVAEGKGLSKSVCKPELRNAMGRFQAGAERRMFKLRVSKKRRVIDNLKPQRGETSTSRRLEDMESKGGGDDLSDTEVTFRLYPRVKPNMRIKADGSFTQSTSITSFGLGVSKSIDNWKKRRELILHRAKKYFYPVEDILKSEGIKQPTVTFKYNSSTQTEHFDVSVNQFTQTRSKCYKSRGTVTEVRGVNKQPRKRPTDVIIY